MVQETVSAGQTRLEGEGDGDEEVDARDDEAQEEDAQVVGLHGREAEPSEEFL